MPHKHKRKSDAFGEEIWDLPPTQRASALPVGKGGRVANPAAKKRKTGGGYDGPDDTPKAFQRLMAKRVPGKGLKGLDDGLRTKKAKKQQASGKEEGGDKDNDTPNSEAQPAQEVLKILPGEKMSDFSQRVNQALPLAGVNKNGKKILGLPDHKVTKHEKKLKRLQKGWREEEARIKDKEDEARELAEMEGDEDAAMWEDKTADLPDPSRLGKKRKNGKGRKKLVAGEVNLKEEDPWEALRKSREQRKGLHDVVQAPPTFDRVPREIFKVKNGAKVNTGNIPNKAGSLRKREALGEERQTIIDTYRKLMADRKTED